MKHFRLALCALLLTNVAFAQPKSMQPFSQHSWFSMNGAMTVPIQGFGNDNLNDAGSGFAKVGYLGKLDFGAKVYNSFGICLSAVGGVNKINNDAFSNFIPSYQGVKKEVNSTPWKYLGGMGGIYMMAPIERGALMLKGQIGLVSVTSYSIDILLSDGNNYERLEQKAEQTYTAIFDLGLIGIIPLNDVAYLNLGLDYLNSSPNFSGVSVKHSSSQSNPEYISYDYKMEIKMVAFNAGITWQF